MPHLFERRDFFGNSPAIWILAAMLFLLPVGWQTLKQIRMENDVENWLPPDDPQLKVLHWTHETFPVEERVFVTWVSSSLNDPRLVAFQRELAPTPDAQGVPRGGSPFIQAIYDPRDVLAAMQKNDVPPAEAVRRLKGLILGHGPLRVRLTPEGKRLSRRLIDELPAAAKKDLGLELSVLSADAFIAEHAAIPGYVDATGTTVDPSPAAVLGIDGKLLEAADPTHDFALTWRGLGIGVDATTRIRDWLQRLQLDEPADTALVETAFFVPGAPVAMAVTLSEAGLADRSEALAAIRAAAVKVGIPAEELKLGGSAVAGTELNRSVSRAIWNPAAPLSQPHLRSVMLSSALVGMLLAFVLLRNARLAIIVLIAALWTTFISIAIVPVTGGTMNMVLVVMPSLLMVVTLSGAIHIGNYWKHASARNNETAVVETCKASIFPCFMAAFTTAIGLFSLCTSSLSPVRDFGLYAALGTMLSFVVVSYGVPAILLLWRGKPPHETELDHPGWRAFGQLMVMRPTLQTIVSLVVCIACSYGLVWFQTETKVIRYFRDTSEIVKDYWYIEGQLAGIVPVETIVRFDPASQEELNFVERMEIVRQVQERLRAHPEITGCLSLPDFQPVSEVPADDASRLERSRYHKRAATMEARIREGEIEGTKAFYALAETDRDLEHDGDRALSRRGEELWRISAQVNVMTPANYRTILADLDREVQDILKFAPGSRHTVTGTVPLFLRTQQAVLDSLITSSVLAFGLILIVFVIQLRSFTAGLIAMIPNVVPITIVFGLISYFDVRVDIGSMITSSIALGMAVDGTLHFLAWFQRRMREGSSRDQAIVETVMHCGPAIWQTSWMVALGLLVLVPAELLLISRFGWLMAAMVGVAMLGDLVLLPQLLASPLGRFFEPATPDAVPLPATETSRAPESLPLEGAAAVRLVGP